MIIIKAAYENLCQLCSKCQEEETNGGLLQNELSLQLTNTTANPCLIAALERTSCTLH